MLKKKKKIEIDGQTRLQRDTEQQFTYIDNEVVMLSLKQGEYYGLDSVGTRIWELLENEQTFSQLIASLMEEFEVEEHLCRVDTMEYLETLYEKELLIVKG